MNKAFIVGRLTKDPEARTTPAGVSVCTLSVAVNRRFDREKTDFFTVIAWRGLADNCARYLVKGQKVAVSGEIQNRSFDGKDGIKRYVTEIIADDIEFLGRPTAAGSAGNTGYKDNASIPKEPEEDLFAYEIGGGEMFEAELPF